MSRSPAVSTRRRSRSVAITSAVTTIRIDGVETSSGLRGRRSNTEPSQPLMTPSSPHAVHRHSIDGGTSARYRAKWPGHGRRPGRRRHGSALTQGCPPSPAVAARTISVRCSAMRRAGPGTSSGRSRKCRRSETNTTHGIAVHVQPPGSTINIRPGLRQRPLASSPPVTCRSRRTRCSSSSSDTERPVQ